MSQRLHDKIRHYLETLPGLTQRGLAERMGVNPAAVNRMLYGRRNIMADELPIIEEYLGVRLDLRATDGRDGDEYRQDKAATTRGFSDVKRAAIEGHDAILPDVMQALPPVPVFTGLRGSAIVDWVPRHPHQLAVRDAYALYVESDDMQPRYFRGEIAYVHPARPAMTGGDCVIEMKTGAVLLRRLVQKSADRLTVQQLNPAKLVDIPQRDVDAVYTIVGRG